jgi:indole-3-glycerol phosphate synthase
MKSLLQQIVAAEEQDVLLRNARVSVALLKEMPMYASSCRSLSSSLQEAPLPVIAEYKRKSPSAGLFPGLRSPSEMAMDYQNAGAAGISVLTNYRFFGGSLSDLQEVKSTVQLPILRKEFLFQPYHIYESKAYGADAILLIARLLEKKILFDLIQRSQDLGMEVLLEVHDEQELDMAIQSKADIIGINNRDLDELVTDLNVSRRMSQHLPVDRMFISESGISSFSELKELQDLGYRGFLIGTQFLTSHQLRLK